MCIFPYTTPLGEKLFKRLAGVGFRLRQLDEVGDHPFPFFRNDPSV
jgi:hypothetical protein